MTSAVENARTPTAGTSPTLAKPVLPEAARRSDEAGQAAFIEYWFDTFDYAIATGDTGPMMAVAHAECRGCEEMKAGVDEVYSRGGHIEGGMYEVSELVAVPINENGGATPTVTFKQAAGADVYPDGRREQFDERATTAAFGVAFADRAWVFHGFGEI